MIEEKQKAHRSSGGALPAFSILAEVVGWLQIFVSPLLLGLIIGGKIYFAEPNKTRLIIAISVAFAGLAAGIVWANRKWKDKGTILFMSRVMATPELDNVESENKKEANKGRTELSQKFPKIWRYPVIK